MIDGGTGDDKISGEAGHDELHGYDDDDKVIDGPGNDFLDGRRGHHRDVLIGGPGNDEGIGGILLKGGPGNDVLDADAYGPDTSSSRIIGGAGHDDLFGHSTDQFSDQLSGGAGADEINGARGEDELLGGGGPDVLSGERGDDALDGGPDQDTCDQGPGTGPILRCEKVPLPR